MNKFSKVFGEVEIISEDSSFTTVKVLKTGEVKKLSNQYANLSDAPVTIAKAKKAPKRELTKEDEEKIAISVEKQMKDHAYVAGLSRESRLAYRAEKSKRTHL